MWLDERHSCILDAQVLSVFACGQCTAAGHYTLTFWSAAGLRKAGNARATHNMHSRQRVLWVEPDAEAPEAAAVLHGEAAHGHALADALPETR